MTKGGGGHIALLTGLTQTTGEFDTELYREQDAKVRVKGIIACSAPTDITRSTSRPVQDLLGAGEHGENPELARAASCAKYINREVDIPPILLIHGTDDNTVSVENSRSLFRLLEEAGQDVEYYEIIGGGHGGALYWSEEVLDLMERFIKK